MAFPLPPRSVLLSPRLFGGILNRYIFPGTLKLAKGQKGSYKVDGKEKGDLIAALLPPPEPPTGQHASPPGVLTFAVRVTPAPHLGRSEDQMR